MRTRPFLRTTESLWQEGHTAHATRDEAVKEAKMIHDIYADFTESWMAMPVIKGVKTANERFAGAEDTYTIEALMQDGKSLQAGTSHFLGQNFARAFDVSFLNENNQQELVWATSWGVSTRLIGGLIMTHSDDEGLVLPPKLAPLQVVIIPVPKPDAAINEVAEKLINELKAQGISVKYDTDEKSRPGFKYAEYEMKGVPVRVAIGQRDLEKGQAEVARRDTREKEFVPLEGLGRFVINLLDEIQQNLLLKALRYRQENTREANDFETFKNILEDQGGFVSAHWDGTTETELKIKELTKATIRCIPLDQKPEDGACILTGNKSTGRVLFAKAY